MYKMTALKMALYVTEVTHKLHLAALDHAIGTAYRTDSKLHDGYQKALESAHDTREAGLALIRNATAAEHAANQSMDDGTRELMSILNRLQNNRDDVSRLTTKERNNDEA